MRFLVTRIICLSDDLVLKKESDNANKNIGLSFFVIFHCKIGRLKVCMDVRTYRRVCMYTQMTTIHCYLVEYDRLASC